MGETTPVLIVAGPTASGKSGLALRLAESLDGVVINADSMQVYRELRILTNRPDEAALARAPHRLYGILPGAERCSVGRWLNLATREIRTAGEAGRVAMVTGGTGLYLKALTDGLSAIPDIPKQAVAAATSRHRELGGPGLHADLAARDPEMAARLQPGDRQRLIRAWSVLEATGRGLSDWQDDPPRPALDGASFFTILLDPPREFLYAACDARFDAMLSEGAVAEVQALDALGLDPELPIMKALGVPELRRHLAGDLSLEAAASAAKQATRNFAKRQYTWFRHQIRSNCTVNRQYSERVFEEIISDIRQFLLTAQS